MKPLFKNKLSYSLSSSVLSSDLQPSLRLYLLSKKGFSFIEVLVVMVIIGIISTIAVPNMSAMMKSYRLKSAANDLASTLQLARLTAISQNANSFITFDTGAQSYSAFSDNGEGGGTLNDGTRSGTEPIIKALSVRNEYAGEITLGTPSFGNSNFFTSQGSSNAAGTILLQNSSGESYQVVISLGGSIKVVKL
jgi:prepilin-type N-terminal cleavage/methylation domain-containing protein